MKKYLIALLAAGLMFTSCNVNTEENENTVSNNDKLLIATLYHQKSAEHNAICLQAYNTARMKLNEILQEQDDPSRLAIVLDLDETVLDNSRYEAKCVLENISYPTGWDEWMHATDAGAIPGAVEFITWANTTGVQIFYITNRREKYRQPTLKNLQTLGIAPATNDHLLLRTEASGKELRRQKVLENYEIVMLFGDNLADFSKAFDGEKTSDERAELVRQMKNEFGGRYIVFPNAMYGEWLNALIDYNFGLTTEEKTKLEKQALEDF